VIYYTASREKTMKIISALTETEYSEKDITFFPEGLTDCEKRAEIDRIGLENDCGAIILENLSYPKGMVGYILSKEDGRNTLRVVYERERMVEDIMDANDCSETEAWDWYSYNTERGCPYCYTSEAPCPEIIFYEEDNAEVEN